jgi:hypothetical protein
MGIPHVEEGYQATLYYYNIFTAFKRMCDIL